MLDHISRERQAMLEKLALMIAEKLRSGQKAKLTFICTHNSRRSQLAQIWAQTAMYWYDITGVDIYSGGTEVTAFNPRVVESLKRAGFVITTASGGSNPLYEVRYDDDFPPIRAFSKLYDSAPNPTKAYFAVMTCAKADSDCPVVAGAEKRVAIPYDDPKAFDGTERETAVYDERCCQISVEMLYMFKIARHAGNTEIS